MTKNQPTYDIAIIGGGIAGAAIARDATLRGCKVILFEKNTFASGTSSKSSKLIHGGIRYLETAWVHFKKGELKQGWKNFRFVFSSLIESNILRRASPKLIRPIALTIPIYKGTGENRFMVYLGTLLYGLMAFVSGTIKAPQILFSKKAVLKRIPGLNERNLTGGVTIWDHQTNDKKLTETLIENARAQGLKALEHTLVSKYTFLQDKNCYSIETDQAGEKITHLAHKVINASGAWIDQVRKANQEYTKDFIAPIAGAHITVKRFMKHSVILEAADGRIFFVINIKDTARIGTTERLETNPDCVMPSPGEIDYLIEEMNKHFPGKNFSKESILSSDAGIRPLAKPENDLSAHHISREHEVRIGSSGVLHVIGVKITDHRRAAEQVVDMIIEDLRKNSPGLLKKSVTRKAKF